ncbi:MAG: glycine zipper 2TM domain-containing protein [Prochlorococcus sp.]|tara:strand:- start:354 stop:761 length:408 start_codon:yes stop_codon:yes gene_type:complete
MPSVKNLLTLLLTVGGLCLPAQAQTTYQPGYSTSTECFKDEYREEYVPGTKDNPGYVRNWTEKVAIACASPKTSVQVQRQSSPSADTNDCKEGSIIGGLLGAGIGGAISRGDGRWLGVPVGAVTGALVGCQVDGG